MNKQQQAELALIDAVKKFAKDPLGFVIFAFQWGKGELEGYDGPEQWQRDILFKIGEKLRNNQIGSYEAIQEAVGSGHGIGKSALVAWVILWAMSTKPDTKGVVTANTETQLKTKTWAELAKWWRLCITKHWFEFTATAIYSKEKDHEKTWRFDQIPWSEHKTEAFAGMHNKGNRIVVIFDEACHDDNTEVLTNLGWMFFKDAIDTDCKLLTMDVNTREAEFLYPKSYHVSRRRGDMITYNKRGASFSVTPNHRMLVTSQKGHTQIITAEDLFNKKNSGYFILRTFKNTRECVNDVVIPRLIGKRKIWPEKKYNADLFAEFLGWYASEGHLSYSRNKYRVVGITQKDTRKIESLCNRLGMRYKVYSDCSTAQVRIHDTQIAEWLSQYGVGYKEKRVPSIVKEFSPRQISIFLDAFRDGDGYSRTKDRDILYTSSKRLADDLQELCFLEGNQSTVMMRRLKGKEIQFKTHVAFSSVDGYVVSRVKSDSKIYIRTKDLKKEYYDGNVYCATMPKNGVLFTRRNGVCMWSGNSAIPDAIWEVTEGALTDENTEIIWLAFGNPTRNTGRFYDCFNTHRHIWGHRQIDSRDVRITNKEQIKKWLSVYDEDSDFFRVRVRGVFPRSSDHQFIPGDIIEAARGKHLRPEEFNFAAVIIGVDRAWSGDETKIYLRQGLMSKKLATFNKNEDDFLVAGHLARYEDEYKADAVFIDFGYGTGLYSAGKQMNRKWVLVPFGGASTDHTYVNKRTEMWALMKDWLAGGGSIPDDQDLVNDLIAPEAFEIQTGPRAGKLTLESKDDMRARGVDSPDDADALALTFAMPVKNKSQKQFDRLNKMKQDDYDPFSTKPRQVQEQYNPLSSLS